MTENQTTTPAPESEEPKTPVKPLLSVSYQAIRFDDIFAPPTLDRFRVLREDPFRALDLFLLGKPTKAASFFFIHGGGWRFGHRTEYHPIMRELNRRGYDCAATGYDLKATIPEQLRDVRHGYDLFHRILTERKKTPNIVVFGTSAGAHLAMMLVMAAPGEIGEPLNFEHYRLDPADWVNPVGLVLQSAPASFAKAEFLKTSSIESVMGVPFAEDPELYRRLSPDTYIRPGVPPIFHMASDRENFFPVMQFDDLADKLRAQGCSVEQKIYEAEHGFFYDLVRPVQREALDDMTAFADRVVERT